MTMCARKVKKVFLMLLVMVQIAFNIVPYQSVTAAPLRQMEKLNRGVVAVKVSNGVFVGWRMFGTDPSSIAFNVYRNGTKVNSSPITDSTNYLDAGGSTGSTYTVRPVLNGQEQAASESATTLGQNYLSIPITPPVSGYSANDCSAGDLDGDGEYEIVIKWEGRTNDNANAGVTDPVCLEGYKLNGKRLWTINLGRNIRGGAHYTQFQVYDYDGDGKAEVACKTADGTKDGTGKVIGNASANYVNGDGYILTGPEFLTVFNGVTGEAMDTVPFEFARGTVSSWGDSYGNRVDRFRACTAYLDGVHPSIIMGRGYYTRLTLSAWDFKGGKLIKKWVFNSDNNSGYSGQGNHNLAVGDVDGDGFDEIVSGQSCIDHDGKPLWRTGLGHGDAMYLGDLNPDRPGLEMWQCLESSGGAVLLDAKNGQQLFRWTASGDTGRCGAADIDPNTPGVEMWAAGSPLFSCTGKNIGTAPSQKNFSIYWDADVSRELLDGTSITNRDGSGSGLSASGCASNNGTKSTPCLQADIFGDWREEPIWRTSDNRALRIYINTEITKTRIYTLMHDPVYRMGIAWQNTAYNQPPNTGFYLGAGMATPPVPQIYLAGSTPTNTPTSKPSNSPTNTPVPSSINPVPQDINGDRVVNMADVILIASRFNTGSSSSNYDIKCDLNNDGYINMSDIIILASKFNYSY
jgi:rhamnogalacturonan endolyase